MKTKINPDYTITLSQAILDTMNWAPGTELSLDVSMSWPGTLIVYTNVPTVGSGRTPSGQTDKSRD